MDFSLVISSNIQKYFIGYIILCFQFVYNFTQGKPFPIHNHFYQLIYKFSLPEHETLSISYLVFVHQFDHKIFKTSYRFIQNSLFFCFVPRQRREFKAKVTNSASIFTYIRIMRYYRQLSGANEADCIVVFHIGFGR